MIRKFVLAAAAIAALGTASLTATAPASAHGWYGGGYHHFHGHYLGGYGFYRVGYYSSCLRTRWVVNRYGELVRRTFNVCYY
jgi:hypothetical protein